MASSPYRDLYLQSLSEAGVDGTLEERLTLPQYRGRIHAKTGSLRSAYALSGYVETARGRRLAFSLLINNPRRSVRTVQDDLCRALVDAPL
jgi:D-alanyl-D-alanine carboxypeptidase/D-alanyl-D-alanine-endopeptidase (penicillin-binding protein 4)